MTNQLRMGAQHIYRELREPVALALEIRRSAPALQRENGVPEIPGTSVEGTASRALAGKFLKITYRRLRST